MREILASIKNRIKVIEVTWNSLTKEQQENLNTKLNDIDKDLRSFILLQLAINK